MSIDRAASTDRAGLVHALDHVLQLVSSQSVLLSDVIAGRLRMNGSDLEALGFLAGEGPVPAGRLAVVMGLTSGAVTRMIDRLERDGFVRRELDPSDRRRVIVRVVPERYEAAASFYEPIRQAAHEIYGRYTDEQLNLILDFLQRSYDVAVREVAALQSGTSAAGASEPAARAE